MPRDVPSSMGDAGALVLDSFPVLRSRSAVVCMSDRMLNCIGLSRSLRAGTTSRSRSLRRIGRYLARPTRKVIMEKQMPETGDALGHHQQHSQSKIEERDARS
jgi:hypothetical protein